MTFLQPVSLSPAPRAVVKAALFLMLLACSTPGEIKDIEQAKHESHERGQKADTLAVETLAAAYREFGRQLGKANHDADINDPENMEAVEVVTLPEPDENGKIDAALIEKRTLYYLSPEMAHTLASDWVDYLSRVDGEIESLLGKWLPARDGNETNYQELRDFLRERWLNRPGFGPDEIRAIGRGIRNE